MGNFSKTRSFIILEMALLIVLVDQVYRIYFTSLYSSAEYPITPRPWMIAGLLWAMALLPASWMPISVERPSQILYWSVYLLVYMPTAVVSAFSTQPLGDVTAMLLIMLAGLGVLGSVYLFPVLKLPSLRVSKYLFWLALLTLTSVFYLDVYFELRSIIRIVGLDEIYIQRLALMDSGASTLASYAQAWTPLIIMPLLMSFALFRRRWWIFITATLGMFFFFTVSAQRIFLAGPFFVLLIYYLFSDQGRRFAVKWVGGAIALFTTPFLLPIDARGVAFVFVDLVLNRSFINSGVLSGWYFEFFSNHPRVHFADVRGISWFINSPYSVSYKEELGWFFQGTRTDPNAHFMADGFAQMGYAGVLIECAVAAIMFLLLDSVVKHRKLSMRFVATAMAMQIPNFMNSAIHTTLLGGGFLFGLLLLYFLPAPEPEHTLTADPIPLPKLTSA